MTSVAMPFGVCTDVVELGKVEREYALYEAEYS